MMIGKGALLFRLLALVGLISFCGEAAAIDLRAKDSKATVEIQSLEAFPKAVTLKGSGSSQQLIVTADLKTGKMQDLTGSIQYEVANPAIVKVSATGRVLPLGNGATQITVRHAGKSVQIPVKAEAIDQSLPINFGNQIVPIFTKLGCNGGGCHGKASGQNGFKLSLLGFEPDIDFAALVYEARGRRLFPAAPERSLLLLKATGQLPHGGGKRMDVDSDEYKLVRRWISAGMPIGQPTDPKVTKISVFPDHRILSRLANQQFAVLAHYSDGSVEDVTRRAQYDSNDTEIAEVDANGLVKIQSMSGEAAIMARYLGHVATFRATVPLGMTVPTYPFPHQTIVDAATHRKWQELGLAPSELCTDEQFIRRASLDITGTLPTPTQVKAFLADKRPNKRDVLVDSLLASPDYSYYFATKWADILRVKRRGQNERVYGTFSFHAWIREALERDKPFDQFAREILTATGDEFTDPATVWYKELLQPEQFVDDLAQVFLGLRMACAQCHHHPYEKWSQDDYWGLAAFFGRLGRKNAPMPGGLQNQQVQLTAIFNRGNGGVVNKRTNQQAAIKPLDAQPLTIAAEEDPRQKLAEWLTDPKNPFFAKALANRYWAHFFGRGIVDPLDDMRVTNPPSNPELLDALAKELVDHKFSIKHLVATICKSRTYQLSAVPNPFNKQDKQTYARYYPKRLGAEVLFDAVCQVTGSPTPFGGLPQDQHAPRRAIMLPDESFNSYFLDVFGRPQRSSACECERVSEANLAQALHLLNSDEVQNKLGRAGGRADLLVKDQRPEAEKVEELFLWAVAHKPNPDQLNAAVAHIGKHEKNKKVAYENILWALLNTKEFVFNE